MKYSFKALPTDPWEGVNFGRKAGPGPVNAPGDELELMDEGSNELEPDPFGGTGNDWGEEEPEPDDLFAGDNLMIGSGTGRWYDQTANGESEVAMDLLAAGENVADVYNDPKVAVERMAPMLVNPTHDPWGGERPVKPVTEEEDAMYFLKRPRSPKKWSDPEEDWVAPPRDPSLKLDEPAPWRSPLEKPGYRPASKKAAIFPRFTTPDDEIPPEAIFPRFTTPDDEIPPEEYPEFNPDEKSEYPLADDPVFERDNPDLGGGYDEYEYEDRLEDFGDDGDDEDIWQDYGESKSVQWTGSKHGYKSFAAAKEGAVAHGFRPETLHYVRVKNGTATVIDAGGNPVRPT